MHHLISLCLAVLSSSRHRASYPAGASLLVCLCSRLLVQRFWEQVSCLSSQQSTFCKSDLLLLRSRALDSSLLQLISNRDMYSPLCKLLLISCSGAAARHSLPCSFILLRREGKQDIIKHVLIEDRQAVVVKLVFFCKYDQILQLTLAQLRHGQTQGSVFSLQINIHISVQ